jgi:acyl-CoA thioesterase YciA
MPHPPDTEPALRTVAMPADTNPDGDIFGGWLLSQMDLAGGNTATRRARGRVVTIAIDGMTFYEPVEVGDELSCYARIDRVGRSSIVVNVQAWKRHRSGRETVKVTEGVFTYVKIDEHRRPQAVPAE